MPRKTLPPPLELADAVLCTDRFGRVVCRGTVTLAGTFRGRRYLQVRPSVPITYDSTATPPDIANLEHFGVHVTPYGTPFTCREVEVASCHPVVRVIKSNHHFG